MVTPKEISFFSSISWKSRPYWKSLRKSTMPMFSKPCTSATAASTSITACRRGSEKKVAVGMARAAKAAPARTA